MGRENFTALIAEGIDSALGIQVGGGHYMGFAIQPVEFITRNGLNFLQGCIIKRVCRFKLKGGGGREDLLKARHEIDLLLELTEGGK
jgi:hypothetical protein